MKAVKTVKAVKALRRRRQWVAGAGSVVVELLDVVAFHLLLDLGVRCRGQGVLCFIAVGNCH